MTICDIITLPDPRLKMVSYPIEAVDDEIRTLMDDMLETMYDAPGIGLAAIQIGVPKRVLVMDVAGPDEPPRPMRVANPEITWMSEDMAKYEEGCLSIPDLAEVVERASECKVRYLDENNEIKDIHCTGLLATCIQHEIDHLNGVLFIDHLSKLKRDFALKKYKKLQRDILK